MEGAKPADRRAKELADVRVRVLLDGGPPRDGRLLDLNAHGALTRLTEIAFERLVVGGRFELELERDGMPRPVRLVARLQYKVQEEDSVRAGWAFPEPEAAWRALQPAFGARVNRRRHPRYRPNPTTPIRVRVHARVTPTRSISAEAQVLDLSKGGVGLLLRRALATELSDTTPLDLRLEIADLDEPLTLRAHLRYRRADDDGWRCGIEFDRTAEDFAVRRAPLLEYLATCDEAVAEG